MEGNGHKEDPTMTTTTNRNRPAATDPKHWDHANLVRRYITGRITYRKLGTGNYEVRMDSELFGVVASEDHSATRYVADNCFTYGDSGARAWFGSLYHTQREAVKAHSGRGSVRSMPRSSRKDAAVELVSSALILSGRSVALLTEVAR